MLLLLLLSEISNAAVIQESNAELIQGIHWKGDPRNLMQSWFKVSNAELIQGIQCRVDSRYPMQSWFKVSNAELIQGIQYLFLFIY